MSLEAPSYAKKLPPVQIGGVMLPPYMVVPKDDYDQRNCGKLFGFGTFLVGLFVAALIAALVGDASLSVACSPHCVLPGQCNSQTGFCVSKTVGGTEVFCEAGWYGHTCDKRCACGVNESCTVGGVCTECGVGYTYADGVCTACPAGYLTGEPGTFSTCDFCATNFEYLDAPPVTCTACPSGEVTGAGPHQETVCVPVV
jgi:hypothetical protein